VLHLVRDIAFPEEACAHVGQDRQLGMQYLDGKLLAVAMRGLVHDSGTTSAEDAIERVLAAQRRSEARARSIENFLVRHRHRFVRLPLPAAPWDSRQLDRSARAGGPERNRSSERQGSSARTRHGKALPFLACGHGAPVAAPRSTGFDQTGRYSSSHR
jgi:hypothetical protein